MTDEWQRNIETRVKRLEELHPPKKSKRKPKEFIKLDPKPVCASMAEKGWTQSDLAAEIWGRKTSSEGKNVAVGKHLISVWLSGKNRMSRKNFDLLAQFVDVV
jgi:hypothetical protein